MVMQKQAKKPTKKAAPAAPVEKASKESTEAHDKAVSDIDELLDEVLETEENFALTFKQAGGQ